MREIKFRAFVFEENRYYKQVCHTDDYLYRLINIESSDGVNNSIKVHFDIPFMQTWFTNEKGKNRKFVLEQYTGLKDKNGVEIYEGDIIQFQSTEGEGLIKKVWFCDKKFSLMIGNLTYENLTGSGFFQPSQLIFELIGNIHENPELLNTQNN